VFENRNIKFNSTTSLYRNTATRLAIPRKAEVCAIWNIATEFDRHGSATGKDNVFQTPKETLHPHCDDALGFSAIKNAERASDDS
jgi:hypothetical protein